MVVNNNLICLKQKERRSTRIEDINGFGPQHECLDKKTKLKVGESSNSWKDWKKKTYRYYGKVGHVENTYWKKSVDLEEKVKKIEGDATVVHSTTRSADNFNFNVRISKALLAMTSHNEWVFDYGCTYHMAKDSSLFSSFDIVVEKQIFVANDLALNISGHGDGDVPSLSADLLLVSQLTKIGKIFEFWTDWFFIKNLKDRMIFENGPLHPKDWIYKFCDWPRPEFGLMALIAQDDERRII